MKRFIFRKFVPLAGTLALAACGNLSGPSAGNVPPTAHLSLDPDSGAAPLAVRLRLDGLDVDGTIVRYRVELTGSINLVLERSAPIDTLITLAEGAYTLSALVEDDAGATTQSSENLQVTQPPNLGPVPALQVAPVSGELPLQVTATAGGTDPDGTIVGYALDMDGDGIFEADSTGPLSRTRRFEVVGTFWLRLRLTDDKGAVARDSVQITVLPPNASPTGVLTSTTTSGEAPLSARLDAAGQDPDGQIVRWEVDAGQGDGFEEIAASGRLDVSYEFRDTPYRPRLRLTDDRGAQTVVDGPEILVFRPIHTGLSTVSSTANPHFSALQIAPAIWADGQDRVRFTVTVTDGSQQPLAGVPVRVRSLRPPLVAPTGQGLGETLSITLDQPTTNAQGVVTGQITTRTSSRVLAVPQVGFVRWDAMVEAEAGHGEWRRLQDVTGLNAETTVSGTIGIGQFFVTPQGLTCVGQPIQIKVQGIRRNDAPSPGQPAAGMFTEIRFSASGQHVPVTPASGYGNWRTDAGGWIVFDYTPTAPDSRAIRAWVDGMPLNIPAGLAVVSC